jgi:bifunctional N-acetylglucosamine-1-phosphate-uridyltransferase/glucosamine-1-phosphate-acetyltransferase GlmU-like protein
MLTDTIVGSNAVITESSCDRATVGDGARVGPYCILRPGAEVGPGEVVTPHSVVEAAGT